MLQSYKSTQEFWIDFLLEEEFRVDPDFTRDFLGACSSAWTWISTDEVRHSVTDLTGEADLIVKLCAVKLGEKPKTLAILIENKINAALQPKQAERYQERGKKGQSLGLWDAYISVLTAPEAYLPSHSTGFDASVSFERIMPWICRNEPARRAFKWARLDEAIAKQSATGVQVVDAKMTAFRTAYYHHLAAFNDMHGTNFSTRPPAPTYDGDYWFILKTSSLPPFGQFRHMPYNGNIEMSFKNTPFDKVAGLDALLEPEMSPIRTGKHLQHTTIRMACPKLSAFDDFSRDAGKVDNALLRAKQMLDLFVRHHDRITEILNAARMKAPNAANPWPAPATQRLA